MLIQLLKWFHGYLLIQIEGYAPERFINLCSNKQILLWNMKKIQDGYQFYISVQGFKQLRPIVRKTKTYPRIIKRFGFPFFLYRYQKRKLFFTGIVLCILCLYIMSLYVWDISIEGGYTHTSDSIIKYLKQQNITCGRKKNEMDCVAIESMLRSKYNDIGWVSAEIKGTRLRIRIKETNLVSVSDLPDTACHIVATKDGVIHSIVTKRGKPIVKIGQEVKKGDILISGIIDIMGDNDVLLRQQQVTALGEIQLSTTYSYQDSLNLVYEKKEYTGNKKRWFGCSWGNEKFVLHNPFNKYISYDIIEEEKKLKIGENFYLPFSFSNILYKEYIKTEAIYTEAEAKTIVQNKLNAFMEKLIEKGVLIVKNNVKIVVDKNCCIASGTLEVIESATEYKEIKESEWRNLIENEYSREDN